MLEMKDSSPYRVTMPGTSRLARIARLSAKFVVGLAAVLIFIILVLFIVNSFDAPLSPQAKALLTAPTSPNPPEENIYLAMAGMEDPGDRSTVEMGAQRIAAYDKALNAALLDPEAALELNKKWDAVKLKFDGHPDEFGNPSTGSIWAAAKTHRQEISALLAANQRLYERYLFLHRLKGYYETARPSFMAPVINPPPSLRTLFLADVANRVQNRHISATARGVERSAARSPTLAHGAQRRRHPDIQDALCRLPARRHDPTR
jgi:hypothetical protein